ncbi:MAG: chemotaxis protein CheD [bacterium]|nr:chemotaxis protein CheD [bacterium]
MRQSAIILQPAHIYVSRTPTIICAVVGSGVAVCIWDRVLCIGGTTYYKFPRIHRLTMGSAAYGNVAIPELLRLLHEHGAKKTHLEAQIIGGATPNWDRTITIGEENSEIARRLLRRNRVTIVSEDTGGILGRKIAFDTHSGTVAVMKVRLIRKSDWQFESSNESL